MRGDSGCTNYIANRCLEVLGYSHIVIVAENSRKFAPVWRHANQILLAYLLSLGCIAELAGTILQEAKGHLSGTPFHKENIYHNHFHFFCNP